jgi:hypothetical protein
MAGTEKAGLTPFLGVHHVELAAHRPDALHHFHARASRLTPWPEAQVTPALAPGLWLQAPNVALRVVPATEAPLELQVSDAGWTHVCIQGVAFGALVQEHLEAGARLHTAPVDLGTGFQYTYARDPEFNVVELEGVPPLRDSDRPWVAHVNVACADLRAMSRFYADLFASEARRSPAMSGDRRLDALAAIDGVAVHMAWVRAGNLQIELIHYSAPAHARSDRPSTRRAPGVPGWRRVALEVTSLSEAQAHLTACGGSLGAVDPCGVGRQAADPEGNALWLIPSDWLRRRGLDLGAFEEPDLVDTFERQRQHSAALARAMSLSDFTPVAVDIPATTSATSTTSTPAA